jgi:hypothetical protein
MESRSVAVSWVCQLLDSPGGDAASGEVSTREGASRRAQLLDTSGANAYETAV